MKREFMIIGVLLLSAAIGVGLAIIQKQLFFSKEAYVEANYEYIRGVITSVDKEKGTVTVQAGNTSTNATSQEKYVLSLKQGVSAYPIAKKRGSDNVLQGFDLYPADLGNRNALQENTRVGILIHTGNNIPKIIRVYYETKFE